MKTECSCPVEALKFLRENKGAFILKSLKTGGKKSFSGGYQIIKSGGLDDYVCFGLSDKAFKNLEEHDLEVEDAGRRWRLK